MRSFSRVTFNCPGFTVVMNCHKALEIAEFIEKEEVDADPPVVIGQFPSLETAQAYIAGYFAGKAAGKDEGYAMAFKLAEKIEC